ncbi:hypothetical protein [Gelidibacter salicanalis]|uniref:Uncharacterized protein n=1 Tax=Gelidibacter salicanalis TaxID=291193 RepID=A0A934KTL1_9FLAO|nr:hypothetical protein [Gelidibacter salicanalis]MBJ7879938.1 hypothetical protein [Gelidibacter salicanalis]
MEYKKQIGKNIVALLLFVALMLPTAIQFLHIFEGHEHISCTDQVTHLHNSDVKCEIGHYYLVSFNYDIAEYPELFLSAIPLKVEADFASLQFHSFKITNTQLRAPPVFS